MMVGGRNYLPLAFAFGALFLLFPLTAHIWEIDLTAVFLLAIVVVAIYSIETKPLLRCAALALAVSSYVVLLMNQQDIAPTAHVITIGIYLIVWRAIVTDILYREHITSNVILGAIVVYCLIGVVWGHAYILVDMLETEHSFSFKSDTLFDYFFFSFVSLTTVGYGDMLPLSPLARGLAVVEAVLGQIFLAIFIARLFGRMTEHRIQDT